MPTAGPASMLDGLTKSAAVLGTVVALGQGVSTWIDGVYKAKVEREQTKREIKLTDIKERSALAESYLHLILNKDTPIDSRGILFSALGELEGHPLRNWAREQYARHVRRSADLELAYRKQSEAVQRSNEADGRVQALEAEIETLNVTISNAIDDPEEAARLQKERIARSGELSEARAARALATAAAEAAKATVVSARVDPTVSDPVVAAPRVDRAAAISSLAARVDVGLLKSVFPAGAARNIDDAARYLQAALQEFNISDPRMAATIVATIVVETPNFEAYEEPESAGAAYEGRPTLGNTEVGDGVRFRGRGYIGLTGRANYQRMSVRLGLGTRLVDSPGDAKSPEVAARILVAWFADRQQQLLPALAQDDLRLARRMVSGGLLRITEFTAAYRKVLDRLGGPSPNPGGPASETAQPTAPSEPAASEPPPPA